MAAIDGAGVMEESGERKVERESDDGVWSEYVLKVGGTAVNMCGVFGN